MPKTSQLAFYDDSAQGWERALYAFLGEKQRRSGSRRTMESYSRMIQDFFGRAGKPPDQVSGQEIFAWAHGRGARPGTPAPSPSVPGWPACRASTSS